MSLIDRHQVRIGRQQRNYRDDRFFIIASEDTDAPLQYFENLQLPRVKVFVIPTPKNSGLSSPAHVLERLKKAFASARGRNEVQEHDEFWLLLDTDHRFKGTHLPSTLSALREARQNNFGIAVSNPCFELWLLLHHADVSLDDSLLSCKNIEARIRDLLGSYNKTSIKAFDFPRSNIDRAIERARALDSSNNINWPSIMGTHVYILMERILSPKQ
jgi:hypothetical protein